MASANMRLQVSSGSAAPELTAGTEFRRANVAVELQLKFASERALYVASSDMLPHVSHGGGAEIDLSNSAAPQLSAGTQV